MEQAVLVHLRLTDAKFGSETEIRAVQELANTLTNVIDERDLGEYDGEEFGDWRCVLYMYGPSARTLYDSIASELRSSRITRGGFAILRFGDVSDLDATEERVDF